MELKPGFLYKVLLSRCVYFNKSNEIISMCQLDYDFLEPENHNVFTCRYLFDIQTTLFKEDLKNNKYLFVETVSLNYKKFNTVVGYVFYGLSEKKKLVFYRGKHYRGLKTVPSCFESIMK